MKRTSSWLNEHFSDYYVKQAHKQKLPARSIFKLSEIDASEHLVNPNMLIVDLGAAPGGWSTYLAKRLMGRGKIWALDILNMPPIAGVNFLQGDFTDPQVVKKLMDSIPDKVDLVLSDMAPNLSGIAEFDQMRSFKLASGALNFAAQTLKPGGSFLIKLFQGEEFQTFYQKVTAMFAKVKLLKPNASRARSKELFLLAKNFK